MRGSPSTPGVDGSPNTPVIVGHTSAFELLGGLHASLPYRHRSRRRRRSTRAPMSREASPSIVAVSGGLSCDNASPVSRRTDKRRATIPVPVPPRTALATGAVRRLSRSARAASTGSAAGRSARVSILPARSGDGVRGAVVTAMVATASGVPPATPPSSPSKQPPNENRCHEEQQNGRPTWGGRWRSRSCRRLASARDAPCRRPGGRARSRSACRPASWRCSHARGVPGRCAGVHRLEAYGSRTSAAMCVASPAC